MATQSASTTILTLKEGDANSSLYLNTYATVVQYDYTGAIKANQLPSINVSIQQGAILLDNAKFDFTLTPVNCTATYSNGVVTVASIGTADKTNLKITATLKSQYLNIIVFPSSGVNATHNIIKSVDVLRTGIMDVYQWSPTQPTSFPSGVSTYTWATGQFTDADVSTNGWYQTPSIGNEGDTLWVVKQPVLDSSTADTTGVTWTAGLDTLKAIGKAGENGTRNGFLELYKWSYNTPTTFPSGVSTYTWSSGQFTQPATLNGWALTINDSPGAGYKLFGCSVSIINKLNTNTDDVTWNTATAYMIGSSGNDSVYATISKPALNVSEDTSGTISLSGTGISLSLNEGSLQLTPVTTITSNGQFTVSVSSSGITPGAITINGNNFIEADATAMSSTTNASITYTFNYKRANGVTGSLSQTRSLARSKAGATGATGSGSTGATGISNYRAYTKAAYNAATPPTAPNSGSSLPPAHATYTWYNTPPALADNEVMWQSDGQSQSAGSSNIVWNTPYPSSLKVGTLQALQTKTGELVSQTVAGQRLSINEGESNEFRNYSSNNKLISSIGDTGTGAWESIFYCSTAAVANYNTANKKTMGYEVLLPPITTSFADGVNLRGLVIGTRFENSLGLDGGLSVDIGCIQRYSGSSVGVVNSKFGLFATCGVYNNEPDRISGMIVNTSSAADGSYAARFDRSGVAGTSGIVVILDGTYAIKATGNIKATGSISVSGNITAYDGSDRRIKENIKPISNPLAKLNHISGNTFKWKQEYYDKQDKELFKEYDVGVIAQEIEAVLPEAVHERSDGVMAVNYVKIVPLLIEAIKEQQVQIEELRNDITRLSK
jgi:hypothetical protein